MHRPLLVTDDPALLDDVVELTAEHSLDLDVAPGPDDARHRYRSAPLVLIGDEAAPAVARAGLPRRPDVLLLSRTHGMARLEALADDVGASQIVRFPEGAGFLAGRLLEASAGTIVGTGAPGRILAVVGGRGGAGATVLAAGLAITAGRIGLRSLLVDADPLGGGADLVLGWENLAGLRWPGLTAEVAEPPALVDALPGRRGVAVLSCDRKASTGLTRETMAAALTAGRLDRDLVVADLPRRLDDAAALALQAADRVLLVVPAELRAIVAAKKVAESMTPFTDALHVVVRAPGPGRLRPRDIAKSLQLPVAGTFRDEPELARRLEHGVPPAGAGRGHLAALCRHILGTVGLTAGAAA